MAVLFCFPTNNVWRFQHHQHLYCQSFSVWAILHSRGCAAMSSCGFKSQFANTEWWWIMWEKCSCAYCYTCLSFSVNSLFKCFAHCKKLGCFSFKCWTVVRILYVSWTHVFGQTFCDHFLSFHTLRDCPQTQYLLCFFFYSFRYLSGSVVHVCPSSVFLGIFWSC